MPRAFLDTPSKNGKKKKPVSSLWNYPKHTKLYGGIAETDTEPDVVCMKLVHHMGGGGDTHCVPYACLGAAAKKRAS